MGNVMSVDLKGELPRCKQVKWYISKSYQESPFFGYIDVDGSNLWKWINEMDREFVENTLYKNDTEQFEKYYEVTYVSEKYLILRGMI